MQAWQNLPNLTTYHTYPNLTIQHRFPNLTFDSKAESESTYVYLSSVEEHSPLSGI